MHFEAGSYTRHPRHGFTPTSAATTACSPKAQAKRLQASQRVREAPMEARPETGGERRLIDYSQLVLIVFGVVLGSFLGVEYGNWRIGRRLSRYQRMIMTLFEINPKEFERLKPKEKRQLIAKKVTSMVEELFPATATMPMRPPPPSRVVTLERHDMYIPHCPHCFYTSSAVEAKPGEWVESTCPTHGPYKQKVPFPKGEEEE
jgi:hypothetical protein